MKRVFTLLCALMLLLTSFSGMVVSAAEADTEPADIVAEAPAAEEVEVPETPAEEEVPAQPQTETDLAEIAEAKPELFPNLCEDQSVPMARGAALEHQLTDAFMDYLRLHFGNCESVFNIEQFRIPYSQWTNLKSVIWYETPELFHVYSLGCNYYTSTGIIANIKVAYRPHCDTAAAYKTCLNKMLSGAEYLLSGVKGNTALTETERALVLHDRLAAWVEYDLVSVNLDDGTHKIYAAYSALGEGLSVCQGYALAYMYLLDQVGIESDLCSSRALNHAWNIVYIDGVAYHVDVTWDDPTNRQPDEFFDDYGRVYHNNFLLSTAGIRSTGHTAYDFNSTPTDTRYDAAGWWRDTRTAVQLVGSGRLFYRSKNDGHVYQYDNGNTWVAGYSDGYVGMLTGHGTKLFYNNKKDVFILDTTNGSVMPFWSPSSIQYTNGYIEGLKYEKGKLYVQLNNGNGYSWRESMDYVDDTVTVRITQQPVREVKAATGATVKVTVKAEGEGLQYVWFAKGRNDNAFGQIQTGSNTFSMKMSADLNGAVIYCVITDMYGNSVTSDMTTLRMVNPAKITTQPVNVAAPKGKTAKVTMKATGDGLKYTWYYMKKGASKYSKDASQKSNYFCVKMSSSWDGTKVYCVVTDKYGNSVKSNAVTMRMGTPAKITTQPKNTTMPVGKTLKLTLKASGKSLKYTWYYMKKGATKYTKDTSKKSNSFSVKMSDSWADAKVYCVVTDKYGVSVKSSVVTLKKAAAPKITGQPAGVTVVKNAKAKVTVKATGDGLKYQWYYAKKGSSKFKKLSSAKSATYSVKMTSSTNGRKVYCVVTDKYGVSVKSKTVTLNTFDTVKAVSGSWKGDYQKWPDGYKQSISKISISITSKGKVTLKAPASGTGYNGGTFKYTLKFVKLSGDTATYRFTNKTETLTVTYSISKDRMTIHLGSGYTQVYKPK